MSKTKKILALALSAAMSLSLLAGCGGGGEKAPSGSNPSAPSGSGASGEAGRVYWLNFKPELDETAQALHREDRRPRPGHHRRLRHLPADPHRRDG